MERTGALLVAWTPDQIAALPGIEANARRNGYQAAGERDWSVAAFNIRAVFRDTGGK